MRECCRQVEAEEVSNSRNNIHQTWEQPYRDSLNTVPPLWSFSPRRRRESQSVKTVPTSPQSTRTKFFPLIKLSVPRLRPIAEAYLISAADLCAALNNFATYTATTSPPPSLKMFFLHSFCLFISSLPLSYLTGRYAYGSFLRRKTNFNKP